MWGKGRKRGEEMEEKNCFKGTYQVQTVPNNNIDPLYKENFEPIRKALEEVGVHLNMSADNVLRISIYDYFYYKKNRKAGRKARPTRNTEIPSASVYDWKYYTYADIIHMMQTMTNKEIIQETGIPKSSFYRRMKTLRSSTYYNAIDFTKASDLEYLKSLADNTCF